MADQHPRCPPLPAPLPAKEAPSYVPNPLFAQALPAPNKEQLLSAHTLKRVLFLSPSTPELAMPFSPNARLISKCVLDISSGRDYDVPCSAARKKRSSVLPGWISWAAYIYCFSSPYCFLAAPRLLLPRPLPHKQRYSSRTRSRVHRQHLPSAPRNSRFHPPVRRLRPSKMGRASRNRIRVRLPLPSKARLHPRSKTRVRLRRPQRMRPRIYLRSLKKSPSKTTPQRRLSKARRLRFRSNL